MAANAIECRDVSKRFRRGERADSLRDALPAIARCLLGRRRRQHDLFWALQNVCFTLEAGGVLGVIGPNGAGKSTLLRILSRILVPDRGAVSIHGRLTALIEVGAGFHPDLTGRENIYLNGAILGMTRKEISHKIDEIVDFASVADFLDTPVKRYSSGMQARLGFSIATHMDPDILLVDEVLAVGDAQFQQRCLDKMRYFANSGRSIIFISHNLQAVSDLCPRTLLLIGGQAKFDGPTGQAIQQYMVSMRQGAAGDATEPSALQSVQLLDDHGRETQSFPATAQAHLLFELTLDRPPSQLILGFAIKRVTDGLLVADYNLRLPLDDAQRGPVPMRIDFAVNLLSGTYSINLFLVDRKTYHKPVYLDFVKILEVTAEDAVSGVAHVSPRLRPDGAALPAGVIQELRQCELP